uniref:Uncharacterized protein n=1 Tax=Lepeophtheirus salmonis TaxID=72036 RepID=A0A0K2UXX9_LEPSM
MVVGNVEFLSFISWSLLVSRSRGVIRRRLRFVLGVDRGSFVLNISNKSIVSINGIAHSLNTTIGKSHFVGSRSDLTISIFFSGKVGARVVISYTVLKGIGLCRFFVFGRVVRWGRSMIGSRLGWMVWSG